MKRWLISAAISTAGLILALPTSAHAFNPQPDPPGINLRLALTGSAPVPAVVGLNVGLAVFPPDPCHVIVGVPLLPPGPCSQNGGTVQG